MIRLQPISTSDLQHYKFMEELLIDSFPPEEYRQLEQLREYTDRTGNFYNNIIFDDDLPVGFITYWDFDSFYYVEHFATNPALRNGGYGTFLKIDAISLGYSLNMKKWQKYIDKIDLYLTVRNVACFTKYSGLNPEVNVNGLDPGYEWFNNIYPETRRYTVGMKIQF